MRGHTKCGSILGLVVPTALMLGACSEQASKEPASPPEPEATASIFGPEAELPAPAEEAELEADLPLKLTIGFPDGGAELDADAVAALETALPKIKAEKSAPITLAGHSDAGGDDAGNLTASEKRGLAVAAWLIDNGVDEGRIEVIAFGEQNPLQPNALPDGSPNELGRAANRRVQLEILAPEEAAPE